jgi:hypothetical protein
MRSRRMSAWRIARCASTGGVATAWLTPASAPERRRGAHTCSGRVRPR